MVKTETPESRILAGARQEFIEHGLGGARMQAIADRCGVNKALLHYYFRSKERLYQAVLQEIVQTMRNAIDEQLVTMNPGDDIRTLLHRFIAVYIRTLRSNPDFPRFMLREMADGGTNLSELIESVAPMLKNIPIEINRRLSAGMESGRIKRISPLHLMLNILGMCIFTFIARPIVIEINKQMPLGIEFDAAFFDMRIETILDMAMHGIAADPLSDKG
ncbi:MAG: TetR/AcrR family transcriptional regulator [Chitinispirillaceae bacterium]|nr:TetR/AcrR family transcriptional regulator [Chitinispirillaceae bacterium]